MRYHIGSLDAAQLKVPPGFERYATGYERASLIDHTHGSVHMGVGLCRMLPGGHLDSCVHANERGIYVLEGELEVRREDAAFRLGPDDFALMAYGQPHALRNRGTAPAVWFDMQSPQPNPPGNWRDMYFTEDQVWPENVPGPDFKDQRPNLVGHFVEQRPTVHIGPGVQGLFVHRFMHSEFGASQFYMMRGLLVENGTRGYHDHPVEESYFVLSGEADMEIEGKRFRLKQGDVAWTGVGTSHAFEQRGMAPFRWLETQAPQFPTRHGVRNFVEWDQRRAGHK